MTSFRSSGIMVAGLDESGSLTAEGQYSRMIEDWRHIKARWL